MINKKITTLVMIIFTLTVISCGNSSQKQESENQAMQQETPSEQQNMEQSNKMTGEQEAVTEESGKEKMEESAAVKETENAEKEEKEASEKPDEELVAKGKELFSSNCTSCHTIGKGKLVGPDLLGVTDLRSDQWLHKWIKNPDQMLQSDPVAKELLKEFMVPMPNLGLTDQQVTALIAYLKSENKKD